MKLHIYTLLAIALSATAASLSDADDKQPSFKITTKRNSDRVEVQNEKGRTLVSITSPLGISQAVIEREDEKWPHAVALHIRLKGLESFSVTNGKMKIEGSASMQDGKPLLRLWTDGNEDMPLDAKSLYWIEVRIVGGDGKPAREIPLKDGHFEMHLPKALFEANPKSITVSWIDFYRG